MQWWAPDHIFKPLCKPAELWQHYNNMQQIISRPSGLEGWQEHSSLQDDKVRCNEGRQVSWLKFSQNKTLFVWLLFTRLAMRQKSIPHDAFIVCSQTRNRPHSSHSYCTMALAKTNWEPAATLGESSTTMCIYSLVIFVFRLYHYTLRMQLFIFKGYNVDVHSVFGFRLK